MARLLLLLLLLAFPAAAADEEVVAGLSQNAVSITTNFRGTEILIFGAVKRETPAPTQPLDVIITLAGPQQTVRVWRKQREAGIWVNADSLLVHLAPSFYAVATSGSWPEVLSDKDDEYWKISIPRAIRAETAEQPDATSFIDAMIRLRAATGQYQMLAGAVSFQDEVLFSTRVHLPANLVEGNYRVRIFLLRDGKVVDYHGDQIEVHKAALESWLSRLSRQRPLVYGLLAIFLAAFFGWAAAAGFRYLKS